MFKDKRAVFLPGGSLTGKRIDVFHKIFQKLGGQVLDLDLFEQVKSSNAKAVKAVKMLDYVFISDDKKVKEIGVISG
jgi:hypothetical protein